MNNKTSKYFLIAGVIALLGFSCWYFKKIVIYLIIAGILAIIGKPMVKTIRKIHIKKFQPPMWLASFITLAFLICIILSLFFLLAPMVGEIAQLISAIDIKTLSSQAYQPLQDLNAFIVKTIPSIDPDFRLEIFLLNYVKDFVNIGTFTSLISSITSIVVDFGIALFSIIFISFFLLMDNGSIVEMLTSMFSDKYENNVHRAVRSIDHLLTRYFIGISIESLGIAILNSLGLIFIVKMDTELAIVVAFLSGVLNIIPYVGPFIGDVLALVMGLIFHVNQGMETSLLLFLGVILIIFIITQFIDNYVFQPIIYSNSVKAHPLEIFLVILIAGQISGIFGILIAIPTYTIFRVIASEFMPQFKFVQKLTRNIKADEENSSKPKDKHRRKHKTAATEDISEE